MILTTIKGRVKKNSPTGNRTRASTVRALYPSQLDYRGSVSNPTARSAYKALRIVLSFSFANGPEFLN